MLDTVHGAAETRGAGGAILSRRGEGDGCAALGTRHILKVPAEATGGRTSVAEVVVPPDGGTPLHRHGREDEVIQVIEGRVSLWCDGTLREVGPGAVAWLPRGSVHAYRNTGDTEARLAVTCLPGGFERFFFAVAAAGLQAPRDMPALAALARDYDLELLGPNPIPPRR